MSSITYSERIKIETFCELGLTNIQMAERLKRSPSTISYELSRCQPAVRIEIGQLQKRLIILRKSTISEVNIIVKT